MVLLLQRIKFDIQLLFNLFFWYMLYSFSRQIPPHRVRLDGVQNLEKASNQTEMSAIMHGRPTDYRDNSGKKVLPHLRKSELW